MDVTASNPLYPVFFRLDKLRLLVIGGGAVGEEKLSFILKSSPNANIRIIAPWVSEGVQELIKGFPLQISLVSRHFRPEDAADADIVVAATNLVDVNREVYLAAKHYGKIVNVADTPDLCDFYMGSIVTRGDLKVAISTNGKSPTFAKRFRQLLEEILPEESHNLVNNLKSVRDRLKGNFDYKVRELNRITATLIEKKEI